MKTIKRILLIFVAIFSYALTAMAENISPDVAATMPFSVSTTGITSIEDGRWKMCGTTFRAASLPRSRRCRECISTMAM